MTQKFMCKISLLATNCISFFSVCIQYFIWTMGLF